MKKSLDPFLVIAALKNESGQSSAAFGDAFCSEAGRASGSFKSYADVRLVKRTANIRLIQEFR
jgi:hypothetical protein